VLNVAVGISAGVAALVSAVPALHPHMLSLALAILAFVTIMNLRGTLDAARVFAIPRRTCSSRATRRSSCSVSAHRTLTGIVVVLYCLLAYIGYLAHAPGACARSFSGMAARG
jgi:amino acid transporter